LLGDTILAERYRYAQYYAQHYNGPINVGVLPREHPNIGVLALGQVGACACVECFWALPVDEKCVEQAAACCFDRLWQVQSGADVSPD
jgi:hypothetical protein